MLSPDLRASAARSLISRPNTPPTKQVQTLDYSCIVFDTAPTGHTLRLLNFPNILEKGLNKLISLKGAMGGMMGQVTRMLGGGEENVTEQLLGKVSQRVQDADGFELKRKCWTSYPSSWTHSPERDLVLCSMGAPSCCVSSRPELTASLSLLQVEGMLDVVKQINQQFKDPVMTTFVCVCIPEFLSLYETERLVQVGCRAGPTPEPRLHCGIAVGCTLLCFTRCSSLPLLLHGLTPSELCRCWCRSSRNTRSIRTTS